MEVDPALKPRRGLATVRQATVRICDPEGRHFGQGLLITVGGEAFVLTCHHVVAHLGVSTLCVAAPGEDGALGPPVPARYDARRSRPERDAVVLRVDLAPASSPLLHAVDPGAYAGTLSDRVIGFTHMSPTTFDARLASATQIDLPVDRPGEWSDPPTRYRLDVAFRLADPTDAREGVSGSVVAYEGGVLGLAHFARAAGSAHERELYMVPLADWADGWPALAELIQPLADATLRAAAEVVRVRDLAIGLPGAELDRDPQLIIAEFEHAYVPRPEADAARRGFEDRGGVLLVGRPRSGKSRLAWELIRERPDAVVVLPGDAQPPARFETAGLAGRELILLVDDLHRVAETAQPHRWLQRLQDCEAHVRCIATSRDGLDFRRVRDHQAPFLSMLGDEARVLLSHGDGVGADFPAEAGRRLAAELGLDDDEFQRRFDGTPGSLTLDLSAMRERYERLRDVELSGMAGSRLLDSVKLVHVGLQLLLPETLVRLCAERIRGDRPIATEVWERLCRSTRDEGFGGFVGGFFRTYDPYLDECVTYDPPADELERFAEELAAAGEWKALARFGFARREHDPGRAIAALRQAIASQALEDDTANAHLQLGVLLWDRREAAAAAEALRVAADSGPPEMAPIALVGIGLAMAHLGDEEASRAAYERARASHHPVMAPVAAAALGCDLESSCDEAGAEAMYREATSYGGAGSGQAWLYLADLLAARGDPAGAKEAYARATGSPVVEPVAPRRLGVILEKEGDDAGAREAFGRADAAGDARAAALLARRLYVAGDLDGALAAAARADERGDMVGTELLAWLQLEHGHTADAIETYRRSDAAGSASGAANLGLVLEREGDSEGASEAYRHADERGSPEGATYLGLLLGKSGDAERASEAFERADRRGDAEGARWLSFQRYRAGDRAGALAAARRADERGSAEGATQLGFLLAEAGDTDAALDAYRRAAQRGSERGVHLLREITERPHAPGAASMADGVAHREPLG